MRVGIVSNTNIIKQNKETNFKSSRKDAVGLFITVDRVLEGKEVVPSTYRRLLRALKRASENSFGFQQKQAEFYAENRGLFAQATRVLKPQEKNFEKKKRVVLLILDKAKQTGIHEVFNFTIKEILPKIVKAGDKELGKVFLEATPIPQDAEIHSMHCGMKSLEEATELRIKTIKEFGSEENIEELEKIKKLYVGYTRIHTAISMAIEKITAAPKT